MSQKSVEIVIGKLATDEALRARFMADPDATLDWLGERGLDLGEGRFQALVRLT